MASKRAFLQENLEKQEESTQKRLFEEPTPEIKSSKKDEKDRFGPTPVPSGKDFLRDDNKVQMRTAHIRYVFSYQS